MIFDHFWRFLASFEAFASQEIHRMPVTVTATVEPNSQGTGLRNWINLKKDSDCQNFKELIVSMISINNN